jgi:hypothetical protein
MKTSLSKGAIILLAGYVAASALSLSSCSQPKTPETRHIAQVPYFNIRHDAMIVWYNSLSPAEQKELTSIFPIKDDGVLYMERTLSLEKAIDGDMANGEVVSYWVSPQGGLLPDICSGYYKVPANWNESSTPSDTLIDKNIVTFADFDKLVAFIDKHVIPSEYKLEKNYRTIDVVVSK